jgi:hypothetical protein
VVGKDTLADWAHDAAEREVAAREGRPSGKNIEACDRLLALLIKHHERLAELGRNPAPNTG